jgi:hypothetical protein
MTPELLLDKLRIIKSEVDFSTNRNDARKAYKLLKENEVQLKYEMNIYNENIFKIERSLLVDENRKTACQIFIIAITKIINILEYNYLGKNYKSQ